MKDLLKKTIESLKEKVKLNLFEIQDNQKEIRNWLKQPVSEHRTAELEEKYALNKILLAENNDFINVQLTLSNFLEKYSGTEVLDNEKVKVPCGNMSEDNCFEMTVNGKISFDSNHPFFRNDDFYNKLLSHFQRIEDYERCMHLVNAKKIEN